MLNRNHLSLHHRDQTLKRLADDATPCEPVNVATRHARRRRPMACEQQPLRNL